MTAGNDERSEYEPYCITIKKPYGRGVVYREQVDLQIEKHIKPLFAIADRRYEIDSKGILHAHMLGFRRAGTEYTKPRIRYWSIDIQPCRNMEAWVSYIQKDSTNLAEEDELLLRHYSYHNNMFM